MDMVCIPELDMAVSKIFSAGAVQRDTSYKFETHFTKPNNKALSNLTAGPA
jgi:hypothetical protein